jgi:hypothetical protein
LGRDHVLVEFILDLSGILVEISVLLEVSVFLGATILLILVARGPSFLLVDCEVQLLLLLDLHSLQELDFGLFGVFKLPLDLSHVGCEQILSLKELHPILIVKIKVNVDSSEQGHHIVILNEI